MRLLFILALCGALCATELTIVYDNTSIRPDLRADWGFSAVLDVRGQRILFDIGAKPEIFDANLHALGIEKSSIQKAIISHEHSPLSRILPASVADFLASLGQDGKRLTAPVQLAPGIYTTGEIPGSPPEQALAIETSKGIVMLVSCAHPGISRMVEIVEKQRNVRSIRLVVGGLHMFEQTEQEIRPVVAQLQKLNVQSVILGHCTGDLAKKIFREAYGERFSPAGAGKRIDLN